MKLAYLLYCSNLAKVSPFGQVVDSSFNTSKNLRFCLQQLFINYFTILQTKKHENLLKTWLNGGNSNSNSLFPLLEKNKTAQLKWARCVFFFLSCFMKNMKLFLTCSVINLRQKKSQKFRLLGPVSRIFAAGTFWARSHILKSKSDEGWTLAP